jgi:hypothetical protein
MNAVQSGNSRQPRPDPPPPPPPDTDHKKGGMPPKDIKLR